MNTFCGTRKKDSADKSDRSEYSSSESLQYDTDTPRRSTSNCDDDLSSVRRLLVLPEVKVKNSPPQRRLSGRNSGSQDYTTAGFSSVNPSFDSSEVTEDVIFGLGNGMTSKQLRTLFPYHIVVNADFNITQMGSKLSSFFKHRTIARAPAYEHIGKFFRVVAPQNTPWEWNSLSNLRHGEIEIELLREYIPESRSSMALYGEDVSSANYHLVGGMYIMNPREDYEIVSWSAMFFITPKISREGDLRKWDVKLYDLPPHFFQKQLIESNEKRHFDNDELIRLRAEKARLEEENERLKVEAKQQDLRYLISNVAHDLKTPLTAFLSGVEVIDHAAEDIFRTLESQHNHNSTELAEQVHAAVSEMSVSIKSIRDINSFMTMTINRCIDYTKASQGLKLTPKYETIDLANVLMLPLSVMQSLQSKVGMSLLPISDEICTHIITDKQWLQENILCLLSNAIKYSYTGMITVSMYLYHPPSINASGSFSSATGDAPSGIGPTAKQLQIMHNQQTTRTSFTSNNNSMYNVNHTFSNSEKATPVERIRSVDWIDEDVSPLALMPISEASSPVSGHNNRKRMQSRDMSTSDKTNDTDKTLPLNNVKPRASFMEKLASSRGGMITSHSLDGADPSSAIVGVGLGGLGVIPAVAAAGGGSGRHHHAHSSNHQQPPMLVFEVDDTGIGLTEEAMENLFNPFRQAQRLAGGTGLGLYSLAKRMEALNGHYGVEQRRDGVKGSMFWFALPYRPDVEMSRQRPTKRMSMINLPPLDAKGLSDHEMSMNSVTSPRNMLASPRPLLTPRPDHSNTIAGNSSLTETKCLHILVVDDSVTIQKMTTTMLRKLGHKVESAENGAEALEKIATRLQSIGLPYDIILMDLLMPVMDGLETMRRLREQEAIDNNATTRHLVIGVSANADQDVVIDALTAGADDFLCKPFTMQAFRETIDKLVKL